MLEQATVPDFFQEETPDALRCQADWLTRQLGLDNAFLANLIDAGEPTLSDWRHHSADLPPASQETLRRFWQMTLHILSFLNFDLDRARELFQHTAPARPERKASAVLPPWSDSSLKDYLAQTGDAGIAKVDSWVTGLRFGDPYAE